MKISLYLIPLIFFIACEEKSKPTVIIHSDLELPLSCMKLNKLGVDKAFLSSLEKLYDFNQSCPFTLTISSKKDIVCNSTNNVMSKNMGKFPKSFLKLELRKGLNVEYSYYVDLYSNVDKDDVKEGFERLKKDLLVKKN